MADYQIVPITEEYIVGFHNAIDIVSRERQYLAFLEAPPIESTRDFVLNNIRSRNPQFVVLSDASVVGWCDVERNVSRPVLAHCGTLGVGLLSNFRDRESDAS